MIVFICGILLFFLSCFSLMASYWPFNENNDNDDEVVGHHYHYHHPNDDENDKNDISQQQEQQQSATTATTTTTTTTTIIPTTTITNDNNRNVKNHLFAFIDELQKPLLSDYCNNNEQEYQEDDNNDEIIIRTTTTKTTKTTREEETIGTMNDNNNNNKNDDDEEIGLLQRRQQQQQQQKIVAADEDDEYNPSSNDNYIVNNCILNNNNNTNSDSNEEQDTNSNNMNNNNDNTSNNNNDDDDNNNNNNNRIRGTRRLLQLVTKEVQYLYIGCIVLLIRLPFSLAIPHYISTTLSALNHTNYNKAYNEIIWLLLIGSIDSILDFWCIFLFGITNQKIVYGLRLDLFHKLLHQEINFFDIYGSGQLTSRLNSDCLEMANDLTWFFRFSIESIVRITGIAFYMIVRCPVLGICSLIIVPIVAIVNKLYGNWLRENAISVQDALANANSVAQEVLCNIRTVVAFNAEEMEYKRYKNKIYKQYQLNIRQLYMTGIYYMAVSTFLINTVVQGTLLIIGAILIQRGLLTSDVLLAFMLYQGQLQNETMNLFNSYSSLIKSSGAGDKVFSLLDRHPPIPALDALDNNTTMTNNNNDNVVHHDGNDDGARGACNTRTTGETKSYYGSAFDPSNESGNFLDPLFPTIDYPVYHIQMAGVQFSYPSRPDSVILNKFDLAISHGQTIALVGASGCGKTTIINLLQRFYDPTDGMILINGTDLKKLDLRNHRRSIGVVTQDPVLFQGTIWDNITYGSSSETTNLELPALKEKVIRAATLAHAHQFIQKFPDGYDTNVGERGVQLSGGQKQRIAIARSIFQKRALLLLDEATSALDTESEIAVQKALDDLLQNNNNNDDTCQRAMTTIVIAHRLQTVRNADRIVVLDMGEVVEQGTHDELMQMAGVSSNSGIYRRMVERASSTGLLDERR